jgi:isocitrate/isopropylmalate dehydrogenase
MLMWDEITVAVAGEFPDVSWGKMLVDAMTMRMVLRPHTLDTIVAGNLHADILSTWRRRWRGRRKLQAEGGSCAGRVSCRG